jgi:hypothetical protein
MTTISQPAERATQDKGFRISNARICHRRQSTSMARQKGWVDDCATDRLMIMSARAEPGPSVDESPARAQKAESRDAAGLFEGPQ